MARILALSEYEQPRTWAKPTSADARRQPSAFARRRRRGPRRLAAEAGFIPARGTPAEASPSAGGRGPGGNPGSPPLAVELRRVGFSYPAGPLVLEDVDLAVEPGELVAVAGPNGGGKTTLVRLVLGLERPSRGLALLFGEPAHRSSRRAELGYLPQRAQLGADAPATVREVVAAGRLVRGPLLGPLRAPDRRAVGQAIERVGLGAVADRPLARLSGGQQQRAFIAKALAAEPSLLVLDEPTTGVDAESQEALAALLDRLHRELGVTILYVSHEFGAVERYVQRIVLVRGGIVFDGPPDRLPGLWHDPSHAHA